MPPKLRYFFGSSECSSDPLTNPRLVAVLRILDPGQNLTPSLWLPAVGKLAGGVRHEVKNIVTVVLGLGQLD